MYGVAQISELKKALWLGNIRILFLFDFNNDLNAKKWTKRSLPLRKQIRLSVSHKEYMVMQGTFK